MRIGKAWMKGMGRVGLGMILGLCGCQGSSSVDDDDTTDADDDDTTPPTDDDSASPDDDTTPTDDDTTSPTADLDAWILDTLQDARAPGLSVGVIRGGEVVFQKGYGFADLEAEAPVTSDTIFMLASVSKTVMVTALMQLWEQGLFQLDDDINGYLPFMVENPAWPDSPITFRMLLTHTSSIRDRWPVWDDLYFPGDSPIGLGEFLEGYLVEGGKDYVAEQNFAAYSPGAQYQYCNIGAALAGYLIESITEIPFDQYCDEHIFQPLGMTRTAWHLADLPEDEVALPYTWSAAEGYTTPGHYGYPDYPDGQLRSTVPDLARFLLSYQGGGEYGGVRILAEATVEEILRDQVPEVIEAQGLIWYWSDWYDDVYIGHSGSDTGVATDMFFRASDRTAVILLANGDWDDDYTLYDIEHRLYEEAAGF